MYAFPSILKEINGFLIYFLVVFGLTRNFNVPRNDFLYPNRQQWYPILFHIFSTVTCRYYHCVFFWLSFFIFKKARRLLLIWLLLTMRVCHYQYNETQSLNIDRWQYILLIYLTTQNNLCGFSKFSLTQEALQHASLKAEFSELIACEFLPLCRKSSSI